MKNVWMIATLAAFVTTACRHTAHEAPTLQRFEFSRPQMGVPFRIVLYAHSTESASNAAERAFARVSELNSILSDYDPDSELSRLSRTSGSGKIIPLSDDLWFILEKAQELSRRSDGAYDITVGPVVNLWRKARREKRLPDSTALEQARSAVGHEKVRLHRAQRAAELLVPNMRLDLGSIAKGYAVDEAMAVLQTNGIRSALVAAAGDLAVSSAPPGAKGWRVEIAPLDTVDAPPAQFVWLVDRALGTSGDLFQHLEINGVRYSHIVNPKTGLGLTDHSLVNAIARDCLTANTLATTASVLGPADGLRLARETRAAEIRILRKPGNKTEVYETAGFKKYYDRASPRPTAR